MATITITNGKTELVVSQKAYDVVYQYHGYKPKPKPRTKKASDDDGTD